MDMDMVKSYEKYEFTMIGFHGPDEDEGMQHWVHVGYDTFNYQYMRISCSRPGMSTIEEWMPILVEVMKHAERLRRMMSFKEFHSRYSHDPIISQLLEKIKRISGFLLGVVVLFLFQHLMGYVETGR